MKVRYVLRLGLRFQIGDGNNIDIWESPWIPRAPNYKPYCCFEDDRRALKKVRDLCGVAGNQWDVKLIRQTFQPMQAEEILKLKAPVTGKSDQLIWHQCPKGQFSVKHILAGKEIFIGTVEPFR
ncbi:phospholipase D alpha 2 [Striga asiatica]|uniref:Phospholipase D alpha 2 n=1 Tax=Striga asiatica TaxID=4170 RepID=A0A5A7PCC1_STRAF|nr:phospholipase D alpha 2 [Striga asiatica]